jgi:hypothetical protein
MLQVADAMDTSHSETISQDSSVEVSSITVLGLGTNALTFKLPLTGSIVLQFETEVPKPLSETHIECTIPPVPKTRSLRTVTSAPAPASLKRLSLLLTNSLVILVQVGLVIE